jgi:hypothetical protein
MWDNEYGLTNNLRAHRWMARTVVWQRHVTVGPDVLLAGQQARRADPIVALGTNRLSVLRLTGMVSINPLIKSIPATFVIFLQCHMI